ncbi:MAG: acyltransferase [Mycoplasmataceae bacterium]|nr:acyltransferase [Mycoplasmataceae bacterium]
MSHIVLSKNTFSWAIQTGTAEVAVPVFAIITGYFLANSQKRRFWPIFNTIIVYMLVIILLTLISGIISPKNFDWKSLIYINNFPWGISVVWYFLGMLIVMLVAPWLNQLIKTINKYYWIVIFIFWFFLLNAYPRDATTSFFFLDQFKNAIELAFYYCVGAWLKTYFVYNKKKPIISFSLLIYAICFALLVCINRINAQWVSDLHILFGWTQESLCTIVQSIAVFIIFINLNLIIRKWKWLHYLIMYLGMMSIAIIFLHPTRLIVSVILGAINNPGSLYLLYWILISIVFSIVLTIPAKFCIDKLNGMVYKIHVGER